MIFLAIGTWRKGFNRLVKAVDKLVEDSVITDEVIAQIGYSSYTPKHLTTIRFCSPDDFVDLVSNARLLISHAGIGTIIHALAQRKPIVVVPRRKELGEVDNEHQFKTAKLYEAEGKILVAYDVSELAKILEQAESFVPVKSKGSSKVIQVVQSFIDQVAAKNSTNQSIKRRSSIGKLWPYKILRRDDDDIKADLKNIMQHFATENEVFDTVVFVPYAGNYLHKLFVEAIGDYYDVNFITVRRASTVSKDGAVEKFVFRRKWASNIMRHLDVLLRLIKYKIGIGQKVVAEIEIDFDVRNKRILVIDDDIATGTTLAVVKSILQKHGAISVKTACISNHFLPYEVEVDYSVYCYKLLRTKNSRDYYAI